MLKDVFLVVGKIALGFVGLLGLVVGSFFAWTLWECHLPSDQKARRYFADHRSEFLRFAQLLQNDPPKRILPNGVVELLVPPASRTMVPRYGELMSRTGAEEIYVRPNGFIEFEIWGFGCAPCTDSFKGFLYKLDDASTESNGTTGHGWDPKPVPSLEDESLPKEHGAIVDGLYVIPLEPGWSVYRVQISD